MFKSKNLSKSKRLSKFKKTVRLNFLTPRARLVFTKLRQAFIKAMSLQYFDLKRHIRVGTDTSGYSFDRVFS